MSEPSLNPLQERVKHLVTQALQDANPSAWFEPLYAAAKGDSSQIPWAKLTPHPYLVDWLHNHNALGSGKSAVVVGCGLGDDAEALAAAGFKVTAFDISPTAIAWCQNRFPDSPVQYQVADLLTLPAHWSQGFDLVFECRNVQALPLSLRQAAIAAVAGLVAPQGCLLIVTHTRDGEADPEGPPWPLSHLELAQFTTAGLQEIHRQVLMRDASVQILGLEYERSGQR